MASKYSVKLSALIEEFNLEVIRGSDGYEDTPITIEEVNRPGLQLTGYWDYFDPKRIQLIGLVENTYLTGVSPETRRTALQGLP